MTKHERALKDAEEFIRKAASRFGEKTATEKDIKAAAHKVRKAMTVATQEAEHA